MRTRLHLLLAVAAVSALTGCPQDPPAPASVPTPAPPSPQPSAAAPEPVASPATPAPKPIERAPEPPKPTPKPTPKKKTKPLEPMDLLSRTAGKVELEDVDPAALHKEPGKVPSRTEDAERRAERSSGKSAWRPKPRPTRGKPQPVIKQGGPLERARPNGLNRDILDAWRQAGQNLASGAWTRYFNQHTAAAQQAMLSYAISRLFTAALQRSQIFARRKLEPPKFKLARERLMKFGVRGTSVKLTRRGSGNQVAYAPPDATAIARQVRNEVACYADLMSTPTVAGGQGTHRGLYWKGDLAGLVIQGDKAQAAVLEGDGQARFYVFFKKEGRDWLLAGRAQRR